MKTLHCDIWENSLTCFADDLIGDDDIAVSFAFVDHDIDTCEYVITDGDGARYDTTFH